MARRRSAVAVSLLLVLAIPGGPTVAASPEAAGQSMQITGAASGYAPRSEVVFRPGWVIDTFQSANTTVRVFGRAGSSVSFSESSTPGKTGSASFSMTSPPTSAADKDSAQQGGEAVSAVAAVIALGMDPKTALEQFGGLDTLDGSTPASDVALETGTGQDAPNANCGLDC